MGYHMINETVSPDDVKRICLDVMRDTMRETLIDYETVKGELELYKTGKVVPLPVDKEHAKMMLIIAMNYLNIKPGEPASLPK